jgi:hypothetical protein
VSGSNLVVRTFGKHGVRTPFSYDRYQGVLKKNGIVLDNESECPDILCSGFHIDIPAERATIDVIRKRNPAVKIFIISEEPLWDLTWHSDAFTSHQRCKTTGLEYIYINHYNSNIFEISEVPYFITTDIKYIARYLMLLSRFENITALELIQHWMNCRYLASCFVERRNDQMYEVTKNGFETHSNLRSQLATSLLGDSVAQIQGKGWHSDSPRQSLPDWHADKLTKTYMSSKFLMAIENTDAPNYVTEKIFDAYSSLAIPIVVKSQIQEIEKIFHCPAVFGVSGADVGVFKEKLDAFKPDKEFADQYIRNIRQLLGLFRNTGIVEHAISFYSKSLINEIRKLAK